MKQSPMTAEEQAFAETHYAMVGDFLHFHRLPEDEFYDVVIFGYLEAVQRNFRVAVDPEKRNFPALARLCMKTAVCRELRSRWRENRKANTVAVSMETLISESGDEVSLHNILADETQDIAREVENRDLICRTLNVATAREFEVLALMSSGFSMAETAQIMGLNFHTVHATSSGLHAKARPIKDGNPPGKTAHQRHYEAHKAEYAERNRAYRKAHQAELRAYSRLRYAAKKAALNAPNIESGSVL